jgi:tetratricopeptide (TPR) repeat protein
MEAMQDFRNNKIQLPPIPSQHERVDHVFRNALFLIDSGDFRLARSLLGDVLRQDPNHVEAIRWMGWCFKQDGDLDNALKCYEQLNQRRVSDQDLFELGEIYYEKHFFERARDAWQDALGQCDDGSPRLFDLHRCIGNAFLQLGDIESAEENYNKALVLRTNSDVLMVNFGTLYFQSGNINKALYYYKKAVELNQFNERSWMGVALVARSSQDLEWSISALLKSLDVNESHVPALKLLSQWCLEDCQSDIAIERLQSFCLEHHSNVEMLNELTKHFLAKGQRFEAELENSRALILDPKNTEATQLKKEILKVQV